VRAARQRPVRALPDRGIALKRVALLAAAAVILQITVMPGITVADGSPDIVIAAVDTDVSSSSPSESESAPSSRQNRVIDPLNLRHQILAMNVTDNTKLPPTIPSPNLPRKRSLVLFMRNTPGAIFRMSSCFALRDIDIIKMESRPSTTAMNLNLGVGLDHPLHSVRGDGGSVARHWNQIFYVDFTPSTLPEVNAALLGNLREYALYLRELGDYCAAREDDVRAKPAQWSAYMKEILMLA
jgi:hypothetical protein